MIIIIIRKETRKINRIIGNIIDKNEKCKYVKKIKKNVKEKRMG